MKTGRNSTSVTLWMIGVMACGIAVSLADDLEPAVSTSSAAAKAKAKAKPASSTTPKSTTKAHDQIELDATQITGNRELPNVMYVVPWKKPDLGDFAGRPPKSLLDEVLAPVDRDVFRRQNRYFAALHPDTATSGPPAALPAPVVPQVKDEPQAKDEK